MGKFTVINGVTTMLGQRYVYIIVNKEEGLKRLPTPESVIEYYTPIETILATALRDFPIVEIYSKFDGHRYVSLQNRFYADRLAEIFAGDIVKPDVVVRLRKADDDEVLYICRYIVREEAEYAFAHVFFTGFAAANEPQNTSVEAILARGIETILRKNDIDDKRLDNVFAAAPNILLSRLWAQSKRGGWDDAKCYGAAAYVIESLDTMSRAGTKVQVERDICRNASRLLENANQKGETL